MFLSGEGFLGVDCLGCLGTISSMDNRHYHRLAGALLSSARSRAGMTQTELAQAVGVTQTVVSAYERGRRQPTLPTLCRLLAAAGFAPSLELQPLERATQRRLIDEVRSHLDEIHEVAARHGASNVRVFGSVASGDDDEGSDIDLLVDLDDEADLFSLVRLERELSDVLGVDVDVVPASAVADDEILAEAVAP